MMAQDLEPVLEPEKAQGWALAPDSEMELERVTVQDLAMATC